MLKSIELVGFKSFGKKEKLVFESPIAAIVGPNGSGKSNVAEAFRFVLGEQSMKSMRSKKGEDLIWGGSAGMPRSNRAAVKVTFDNTGKELDIDFPEVEIERVVHRDGQNEYLMNGSKVRLKDVIRLLAGANIGGSGYQIISQGEADRILNASPRERREMVEDALGLKLYQHKKAESERKLEETHENIEKVGSLRRELAPHLKFLRQQVEKLERVREMKEDLRIKLSEYLARENAWLEMEGARIKDAKDEYEKSAKKIEEDMENARAALPREEKKDVEDTSHLQTLDTELREARAERERLTRELGRAEARLEIHEEQGPETISVRELKSFSSDVEANVERAESAATFEEVKTILNDIRNTIRTFLESVSGSAPTRDEHAEKEVKELNTQLEVIQTKETDLEKKIQEGWQAVRQSQQEVHEAERVLLTLDAEKRELNGKLNAVRQKSEVHSAQKRAFEEEVREGIALLGREAGEWQSHDVPDGALSEERGEQEKRRRDVERLKIKIEEFGAGSSTEIMKEFDQTRERDEFLTREVNDLEKSAESLKSIIEELDSKIDERFQEGLVKINEALQEFFSKLFGGGAASLNLEKKQTKTSEMYDEESDELIEEKEELVRGLDIAVSLPRKKVRGLEVLSGGERALTSIAMIFAMSQVNPPPFLILDETDAALDEANSKRYADMVKALGKRSQLILISHNRATMSAAGELYGVTMGSDGVSKLLSVKLEEAERVAK